MVILCNPRLQCLVTVGGIMCLAHFYLLRRVFFFQYVTLQVSFLKHKSLPALLMFIQSLMEWMRTGRTWDNSNRENTRHPGRGVAAENSFMCKVLSINYLIYLIPCWKAEILNSVLRTEKGLWDQKWRGDTMKCNYEVRCGKLTTGQEGSGWRTTQGRSQLPSVPTKGVQGNWKGPKLVIDSDYQVGRQSGPKEPRVFPALGRSVVVSGPLPICVTRRHSCSFRIRQRQG